MKYLISLCALCGLSAFGQPIKFPPSFEKLSKIAVESVDLNLDASMLKMGSGFLSNKKLDEAKAKDLVSKLKGIHIRSFEFDKPGLYQDSDVAELRAQFQAPEWSPMLSSVSNKQGKAKETVHMLIRTEKGQKTGFVIVAAEPKELTVVYIEGQINPDELGALGGNFGIPKIEAFHGTPQSSRKE